MEKPVIKSVEVHAGSVDYQTFGADDAPETTVLLHASAPGAWSRFDLKSPALIEPMAFGMLDPVTDKAAIDYDRNMTEDLYLQSRPGRLKKACPYSPNA